VITAETSGSNESKIIFKTKIVKYFHQYNQEMLKIGGISFTTTGLEIIKVTKSVIFQAGKT
jgi:hypothetical protein